MCASFRLLSQDNYRGSLDELLLILHSKPTSVLFQGRVKNVRGILRRCDNHHSLKCQWGDKRATVCFRLAQRAQAGPIEGAESFICSG